MGSNQLRIYYFYFKYHFSDFIDIDYKNIINVKMFEIISFLNFKGTYHIQVINLNWIPLSFIIISNLLDLLLLLQY
jgi:hypothetical protein